jgi:predicted glycogen debranching enzyme
MKPLLPVMTPAPGENRQAYVGDTLRFALGDSEGRRPPEGWQARLRTNLGRAEVIRREVIEARTRGVQEAGASWQDMPMESDGAGWSLEITLGEVGFFRAKAYLLDPQGWQHWPDGPDVGICVHPDSYRTGNILYCAFPRLFGPTRTALSSANDRLEQQIRQIEQHGYTIIPPSGKLRDLARQLPHIVDVLGCRILHLLPVNPTPTTYARFGRFGSPYAAQDLTGVDPALIEFDRRTTGIDQFRELTFAAHQRGARVFLDFVINHTGWGSWLQENHPEWFLREPGGLFISPGAWGTIWEDLVELRQINVALWDKLAEVFVTWCRRGVDGFRCDAGYMVPVAAWQYIIARVQQEFPETIFLLEGLGGSWAATESLLKEGRMQWAYSELFQNYTGRAIADYLDYSLRQSNTVGLMVHYSETHDNDRLAKRGRAWSLLRNRLCALASVSGGFGFTCGVEWLATEKIRVHGSSGLAWDARENVVPELAKLNQLLAGNPCFYDGAKLARLSPSDSPVYALLRESAEGLDRVLVLVNNDTEKEETLSLGPETAKAPSAALEAVALTLSAPASFEPQEWKYDLLGQSPPPRFTQMPAGEWTVTLPAGSAWCLAATEQPRGLSGDAYRRARALAAWAVQAISRTSAFRLTGKGDWRALAAVVERSPAGFLGALRCLPARSTLADLEEALAKKPFPLVVRWSAADRRRITPIPPDYWLLIEDSAAFRAVLKPGNGGFSINVESIKAAGMHIACFPPGQKAGEAQISVERYGETDLHVEATVRFLAASPAALLRHDGASLPDGDDMVLLTNGIGGMARLCVDLGRIRSKYDCALAANLRPEFPVDRHVFVKRIRVWVNADGFISPLDLKNLARFEPGPPALWRFCASAGDGRTVDLEMRAAMVFGKNTSVFEFSRPAAANTSGKPLPPGADVRLTVRFDIEDRNFHSETKHNGGADYHFSVHTHLLTHGIGFSFRPAEERHLRVFSSGGEYHAQAEWSDNIQHPVEQSRGQEGSGDAFSPGWFDLPMPAESQVQLTATAEAEPGTAVQGDETAKPSGGDPFERELSQALRAFVVRRGSGKTVIAGYPWFLDWGRDTFICARGLIAAGLEEEVSQIVTTFARFEKEGTLPNLIHGDDASNRDTSDAPLWFALACEELAAAARGSKRSGSGLRSKDLYAMATVPGGRDLRTVLESIALNYLKGTPNGIRVDAASGLVWSPSHFTWMDTNHPAGTPREGYPVEIQALWIRLLRQLAGLGGERGGEWHELAERALASLEKWFWLEEGGYYADVLMAACGQPAAGATASDALRGNCVFPVSLGLVRGERAKRCVEACARWLVVPGALRTLAPLPVKVPLPVVGNDGRALNDPYAPYWGRYEGDEDTRRKPAYHNGTAWTWTFPNFCEALARAWDFDPAAVVASRAYLGCADALLARGCLGQLPEIVDGDAPHTQRGCDAQAWGVSEALRVWKLLNSPDP